MSPTVAHQRPTTSNKHDIKFETFRHHREHRYRHSLLRRAIILPEPIKRQFTAASRCNKLKIDIYIVGHGCRLDL